MRRSVTYQQMCHEASVTDMIHAMSDSIPNLWGEVAKQKEYADLGGDDYDPCETRQKEISRLIGQLKRMHAELGQLRAHRHEWSPETDYCVLCGADGRA